MERVLTFRLGVLYVHRDAFMRMRVLKLRSGKSRRALDLVQGSARVARLRSFKNQEVYGIH